MQIKNAKYVSSAISVDKCVETNLPEFAFIGRSNVGKSSLINMLTGNARLAMTSSVPGKTILINHFQIDDSWYLVDLPGYGYAKRGKAQQARLYNLFLLIDGNIAPQKIDLEFITFLGENNIPFSIVFTKMDKSKKVAFEKNIKLFMDTISSDWEELPPYFTVSSLKRIGQKELLDYIELVLDGRSVEE